MTEIKCSYDSKRQKLAEIVPLNSPLSMYIEPTKQCNFKCFYCMHATRGVENGEFQASGYHTVPIDRPFFDRLVKDIMQFPVPPKRICFSGLGEPLMNQALPELIQELRTAGFTGRIDVITNAYALTHEMTLRLIAAGISRIQISIQGLCAQDYLKNCGVEIDFERLLDQISYFYQNKKDSIVFVKIIDSLVETEAAKKMFFEIFSERCDQIFIEHLIVMQQQMGDHGGIVDGSKNLNNEDYSARDVCPVSFYHLQVSAEGYTFPCPIPGLPSKFSMGNAREKSLQAIWNGDLRKGFLKKQLEKNRSSLSPCGRCVACAAVMDPNENLDDDADRILEKLKGDL